MKTLGTRCVSPQVISYPIVLLEASRDDMLVDDKVDELVAHGMTHLLGVHHE